MTGMDFTIEALWEEWERTDVSEELRSTEVPIYLFEGRHDWTNPTVIVEAFYESLDDDSDVRLFIFDNSAHFPMIEEEELYKDLLINLVVDESVE
jgi:pimeloyl-ACP methyl ester carboxylesterase